jgi:DNA-binding MarR family transcriptional regulator
LTQGDDARTQEPIAVPSILDSLEQLAYESVGMTELALAHTSVSVDLTLAQWRALVELGRTETLSMGVLAHRLGMSLTSASRLVGRLERGGLVQAERGQDDRRVVLVRITVEGSRVRTAVAAYRRALMETALANVDEGFPADLEGGLEAIANAFRAYE